ncbi:unnamed protein product [Blepharisma stoltei]|uniref:Alpha-tubulin N-acetyltransferase n=1 Tax=Blepharisma stoltei TaxID=1481888 RepID=A0AAU9J762_9CILI|nr:unnamed protein product [Blepharisma stoltei]
MEFGFDVRRVLRPDEDGFTIITPQSDSIQNKELCEIINEMGKASARAQSLGAVITTPSRFFSSSDSKLYIKSENQKVIGILKTGRRKLFYTDMIGKITEMTPLCLLDFYVHESMQRHGHGKLIYERMLEEENVLPNKIAIDRPSNKLISFMRKHYGLADYIPQNNNFVIYHQFFDTNFKLPKRAGHNSYEERKEAYHEKPQEDLEENYYEQPYRKTQDLHHRPQETYNEPQEHYRNEAHNERNEPQRNYHYLQQNNYGSSSQRCKSREDKILDQIRSNIVVTEDQLKETRERITKMEAETKMSGYQPRAPWATSGTGREKKTSSSDYGAYLNYQKRY